MSEEIKLPGGGASQGEGLLRGGIWFFGGLLLCTAALLAQAAWLHSVTGKKSI